MYPIYFIAVRLTSSEEAGLHLLPRAVSIEWLRLRNALMNDSLGFFSNGIRVGRIVYAKDRKILLFQPRIHMLADTQQHFDGHLESEDFIHSGVG
jgi:hypothetical protein